MTEITDHRKPLPIAIERFVLHWGEMGGQWGVNRSVSQIHALLYLSERPLTAKVISTVLATTFAYFGNRHWTFRHRERRGLRREYILFFGFNAVGLAIALGCLGVSHYVLRLTSPLADNVSANVIGMVLGTVFRFWAYRRFVFTAASGAPSEIVGPLTA